MSSSRFPDIERRFVAPALLLLTEERRLSWCLAEPSDLRRSHVRCQPDRLYSTLCGLDFSEFNDLDKSSVVGRDPAAWAHFYRLLLLRGRPMQQAVRDWLRSIKEDAAAARIVGEVQNGGGGADDPLLLIDRYFEQRALQLAAPAGADAQQLAQPGSVSSAFACETSYEERQSHVQDAKEAFLRLSAPLGWARFFAALQNDKLRHYVAVEPYDRPAWAAFVRETVAGVRDDYQACEQLRLFFQPDGPIENPAYVPAATQEPFFTRRPLTGVALDWYVYLFRLVVHFRRRALLEFAIAELGIYTVFYQYEMVEAALASGDPALVRLLLRIDRTLLAHAPVRLDPKDRRTKMFASDVVPGFYERLVWLGSSVLWAGAGLELHELLRQLQPLYLEQRWAQFDSLIAE